MTTLSTLVFCVIFAIGCGFAVSLLRHPTKKRLTNRSTTPRWGFVDVLGFFLAWMAAQSLVVTRLNPEGKSSSELAPQELGTLMFFVSVAAMVAAALATSVIFWRCGHAWREFGLVFNQWRRALWLGFVAFTMSAPLVWLVHMSLEQFVEYEHASLDLVRESPDWLGVAKVWVTAVICAPIIEELFFRCILLGWLQRVRVGRMQEIDRLVFGDATDSLTEKDAGKKSSAQAWSWAPLVISSLLFALMHLGQGAAPVPLFLFGFCLAILYQATGSVLACIVTHMILNLFGVLSFTFPGS